jgi:hypothetical protein
MAPPGKPYFSCDPAPWIRATVREICSNLVQEAGQMRKSGFSEKQIIRILREYEARAHSPLPALIPPVLSGNLGFP